MRSVILLGALLLAGCTVAPSEPTFTETTPAPAAPSAPYAGEQVREIKALSPSEIEGYRTGAGLGYALPAELNSYPGPLHALEMADRLGLTADQREQLAAIRQDMLAEAVPLGERYLVVESLIEDAFRTGEMDRARLQSLLDESADIESRIRYAHLEAHLDTKALLTPHQVAMYDEARGYGAADHSAHEHG